MSLKLNSSGGGSVTLQEPTTASALTLSLPAVNGNVVTTGDSGTVTPTMLSTGAPSWTSGGDLSFNSGYGSVATAYGCRAWVNFNGTGTVAIRASGNVSSITDAGTGAYEVNFSNSMPNANYAVVATCSDDATTNRAINMQGTTVNVGSCLLSIWQPSPLGSVDSNSVFVSIFR